MIPLENFRKINGLGQHNGNHPHYRKFIKNAINDWSKENKGYTDSDALDFIKGLQDDVMKWIKDNPTQKIDKINIEKYK